MDDDFDDNPKPAYDVPPRVGGDALPKRRPGRPKGSKNRKPGEILTQDKLAQLYDRFSPYLDESQKAYIQSVMSGQSSVDCFREMELLVRQMSLLFQEAATHEFAEGYVSQNLGKFADSLRQAIKDLKEMRDADEEKREKKSEVDGLVPITERGAEMARIASIIGELPE